MKLNFNSDDLANLALQRTHCLIFLGGRSALDTWMGTGDKAPIKKFLEGKADQFLDLAIARATAELQLLEGCFDFTNVRTLTSIGPGLCLFELLLYKRHPCSMYLVDIEHTAEHSHRFRETGSGYSSNEAARAFLEANGVPAKDINFCNPQNEPLDLAPVDVIMSNYSLGFHYPMSEYGHYITTALKRGGTLIFDRMKKIIDPSWLYLSEMFEDHQRINFGKYEKVICQLR